MVSTARRRETDEGRTEEWKGRTEEVSTTDSLWWVLQKKKKKKPHTHKLTNTNDSKLFDHTLYVKIQPFLRISHNCNRKYTFNIFLPSKTITHMYFTDDTLGSTNLF